jgi:hypothetical protein
VSRLVRRGLLALGGLTGCALPSAAQMLDLRLPQTLEATAPPAVPFSVGERLTYNVKLGWFNVGDGELAVLGVDSIRGAPSYHLSMALTASAMFGSVKVRDRFSSWMDVRTLASRRFIRDQHEHNYKSYREFEIYPEEKRWERTDEDKEGITLSEAPLDEIAFLYWMRTLPLEVGESYTFEGKYFKEDGNPVVLKVLRREEKETGAGRFDTIVVQPIIRTKGLFSEGGKAEVYLTDDEDRLMVYLRSEIPVAGSITLHLERIEGVPGRNTVVH